MHPGNSFPGPYSHNKRAIFPKGFNKQVIINQSINHISKTAMANHNCYTTYLFTSA